MALLTLDYEVTVQVEDTTEARQTLLKAQVIEALLNVEINSDSPTTKVTAVALEQ